METTAREYELLQDAAYRLLREEQNFFHTLYASCATDELPGRVMRDRVEDEKMAWSHARMATIFLLDLITDDQDEREFLLVNMPKMSHADCEARVMEGVRVMQEIVDGNPWQYGVVQDRERYVERGILTVVEAWDNLTDILTLGDSSAR